MLATLQVPDVDGPIIAATGQPAPIGTHLERLHGPLMRLLYPHALPTLDLPPAQPAVTVSTDQPLPTGRPGYRRDHSRMPPQGAITRPPGRVARPTMGIPHKHLPPVSRPPAARAPRYPLSLHAPPPPTQPPPTPPPP